MIRKIKKIIILMGISNSGKSRLAQMIKEIDDSFHIMNSDSIREEMYGEYRFNLEDESRVWGRFDEKLERLLGKGENIILDTTNLKVERRVKYLMKGRERRYNIFLIFLYISYFEAKEREIERRKGCDKVITLSVIRSQINSIEGINVFVENYDKVFILKDYFKNDIVNILGQFN